MLSGEVRGQDKPGNVVGTVRGCSENAEMRHALIVPVCRAGDELSFEVPAFGSRMVGPVVAGQKVGGFLVEIPARDEEALFGLAFALKQMLAGKPPEDSSVMLCRLKARLLGYDGLPLDESSEIAESWASFERDAEVQQRKPRKSEWARQFVEEREQRPWFDMSSDDRRAAATLIRRLNRLSDLTRP